MWDIRQKLVGTEGNAVVARGKGVRRYGVVGDEHMVTEDSLTGGGGHTELSICRSGITECTHKTYMILLTNVTLIKLILKTT